MADPQTHVNVWDVTDPIKALIQSREPVSVARLGDADVPLEDLVPESSLPART